MRKPDAKRRFDGEQTRLALIEAAGFLAGEYGWANVQAKQVCERAGVNAASVNYWFGSRDALYKAVVARIPEELIREEIFQGVIREPDMDVALERWVDFLIDNIRKNGHWAVRVWAREVTGTPSPAFLALAKSRGVARVDGFSHFMGRYLGIEPQDPRVGASLISMMAVMFLMMTVSADVKTMLFPVMQTDAEAFHDALKRQMLLGVRALKTSIQNR